ncbi:hypothetical protein A3A03_02515 [Candidatus Nomurabacteria bacterium RIFCSPLOWO2_01_FULL_40_18]|uniref:DNA 3'-5' helicase n=1 Tax=Candidatus Nomurabacteria bacterium RIFCSPLOWO2_01_FULL_40_18 TaxID=1801773 RepID=A0A1F6XKC4_9BACT|nr:MAG: hypothetical protein A3A03_02515 [Candidatus Nomurabacteria bacterium RIFCSPLOWO2_01_FULL_40_18]
MKSSKSFEAEYKKLNKAQKEAVDTLDGPVMVVAGPGTGKTQILALRIGNILLKTDIKADAILCLTFTNSAVEAMKRRLINYIGETGEKVNVFTFHSFGMQIIESYHDVLGFQNVPKLLDDSDTALLFDKILYNNDWGYLRPRSDSGRYFLDLRSLISLLKRERISPDKFLKEIDKEIRSLESNPENISNRGENKGGLKKEFLTKIESLRRSREVAKFFELYEETKKENRENILLDYDDVLENLVKIVEKSENALADLREKYLYVLVDEHQDSNRVQNEFLKIVWSGIESPNIFVVGDDRQLIYGFSGASIKHFQGFKKTFQNSHKAKLITLVDNYRSTQLILDASHALLPSAMTDKKLISQNKERHPIRLLEAEYPRQEIIVAAMDIKEKTKDGVKLNDCAILVSKNIQVRNALLILDEMGLAGVSPEALNLFDQGEANAFFRVLKIINGSRVALALSFFDQLSGITPLEAHQYLSEQNMREFSLDKALVETRTLFGKEESALKWVEKLAKWKKEEENYKNNNLLQLVETIGREFLLSNKNDGKLVTGKEILTTILALVSRELEKNKNLTFAQFISLIERLESYGEHIPVVTEPRDGIKVLTLHSSKGLEFDYVWIAHLDERSLNSGKKMSFSLPESIAEKVLDQDIDRIKRKLYVAITRAKRFCTLSFARNSAKDSGQEMAQVIADLPEEVFQTEKIKIPEERPDSAKDFTDLVNLVGKKYADRYVSASLLNNFFECPWKWYFVNLLGLPSEATETLEFGSVVHASIDRILKTNGLPALSEVEKIILEEVSKISFKDERARRRMTGEVRNLILLWVKNRLPQIEPNRKTEEGISLKDKQYPHLKIFGKIDLIENLSEGAVRVTDFKTGSVKRASEIEKLDEEGRSSNFLRQLAMYSYLLENNPKWGGVKVKESQLEFLEAKAEKNRIYQRAVTNENIQLLMKDIKDYDTLVKTGEWVNRECHYNSYGKNTECEFCQMAEIYK